jgi:hypothetical protein
MPIGVPQFEIMSGDDANLRQRALSAALQGYATTRQTNATARYNNAKAAEQEAQNPYAGRKALEDMLHQKLQNEWYGRDKESEINLRGDTGRHYREEDTNSRYKREHGLLEPEMIQLAKALGITLGAGSENINQPVSAGNIPSSNVPQDTTNMKRHDVVSRANADQASYDQKNNITNNQPAPTPSDPQQQLLNQIAEKMQQNAPQQQEQMVPGTNISMKEAREALAKKMLGIPNYDQSRGGSVKQKNLYSFINAIAADHPEWTKEQVNQAADAYLSGDTAMPDGTPLPELGGIARQNLENVQSGNAPTALKTQYAQMDMLANDLNEVDIDAISSFTGIQGKAKLAAEKAKMAVGNPNVDPMARRYLTAVNQAIYNMDAMRKSLGTSIVPDYVYQTVGKLVNPNSDIYNDKKQVADTFKATQNIINKNRDIMKYKIQHGVTAELPEKLKYPSTKKEWENGSVNNSDENGKTTIIDSNGAEHLIDSSNLEEARKIDPGLKVKK